MKLKTFKKFWCYNWSSHRINIINIFIIILIIYSFNFKRYLFWLSFEEVPVLPCWWWVLWIKNTLKCWLINAWHISCFLGRFWSALILENFKHCMVITFSNMFSKIKPWISNYPSILIIGQHLFFQFIDIRKSSCSHYSLFNFWISM